MPKKSFTAMLPASFLEAVAEFQSNPARHSFIRKDGTLAYLPFVGGGAADDAGENGAGDAGESGDDTDDKDDKKEEGDDKDDDSAETDGDADGAMPENIKAILRKERRAARDARAAEAAAKREAADAKAKAQKYEDAEKTEAERLTGERDSLKTENAQLRATNQRLALGGAFRDAGYDWHSPEDALDMALKSFGLADVEIGEDGKIDMKAVKKIAKELATEKAFLVKTAASGDDKEGGRSRQSGRPYNGKPGDNKAKNEAALTKRYPAMGGRRRVE
jgi:hypothetical protein